MSDADYTLGTRCEVSGLTIYGADGKPTAVAYTAELADTIQDDDYREACERSGKTYAEARANAVLYASAPPLLASVEALRACETRPLPDGRVALIATPKVLEALCEALRAARGY